MKLNIPVGCKIHNRFDIEVRDVRTGEIIQKGQAENIILNSLFKSNSRLMNPAATDGKKVEWARSIAFGIGTGDISNTRTSLFNLLDHKVAVQDALVINGASEASYRKMNIKIEPSEHVGKTITEVGIMDENKRLYTHALIKDVEGNPLAIGPKTDFQEITIYATIYANLVAADGIDICRYTSAGTNHIIHNLLGVGGYYSSLNPLTNVPNSNLVLLLTTSKDATNIDKNYFSETYIAQKNNISFKKFIDDGIKSTDRIRFGITEGNGKIWSIFYGSNITIGSLLHRTVNFRLVFPNSMYSGHHFEGKAIGVADGETIKFILPWSDINTEKEYKFYVNGALQTKDVDYVLSNSENETSITFFDPPDDELPITGDWWVDYIPKDSDHVLDIEFTLTFWEGA